MIKIQIVKITTIAPRHVKLREEVTALKVWSKGTVCYVSQMWLGCSFLTLQQIVSCLILNLRCELLSLLKVLENKNVGSKVDHVLLTTPKGQPQQLVQVI